MQKSGPYTALQKKPANKLILRVSLCNLQLHGCHLAPTGRECREPGAEPLEKWQQKGSGAAHRKPLRKC